MSTSSASQSPAPLADHMMIESEFSQWKIAQGQDLEASEEPAAGDGSDKAPKVKKERAKTQKQLNEMLLLAAERGDVISIKQALELGADLHARVKTSDSYNVIRVAMERGHEEASLFLLELGALCGPSGHAHHKKLNAKVEAYDVALRSAEGLSEEQKKDSLHSTFEVASRCLKKWEVLKKINVLCQKNKTPEELLEGMLARRFSKETLIALEEGVKLTTTSWGYLVRKAMENGNYEGLTNHPLRADFFKILDVPGVIPVMSTDVSRKLFYTAVATKDTELFLKLMDCQLKPSSLWKIEEPSLNIYEKSVWRRKNNLPDDTFECSMLWASASMNADSILNVLLKFPVALQKAKENPDSPWAICMVGINRLMDLMDKGLPINGVDHEGNGIAHVWAKIDDKPRAGWATLAKRAPDVFALKNAAGVTGMQMMAQKLTGKEKDDFLASLSRIEEREIKREIAHIPVAKTKPEVATRKRL